MKRTASIYDHPAILEFAARTNAETVKAQAEAIRELEGQLAILREHRVKEVNLLVENATHEMALRLAKVQTDLVNATSKLAAHSHLQKKLEDAVIELAGKPTTLWTIVEEGDFRGRCPNCREISCGSGCGGWQLGTPEPYDGAQFEFVARSRR